MSTEPEEPAPQAPTPPVETEEATFDAQYVARLRSEAAQRRREAKVAGERITTMELEMRELREDRFRRTLVDVNEATRGQRLVDVDDLLTYGDRTALVDDAGKPDPARIEAAIGELITKKPYLAIARGAPTRGVQGGSFVQPAPSLGQLLGHAARGEPIDRR